jgi:DNA repair protein RadC
MTHTLFVREGAGYREARPADVLERATALLAQRLRPGCPVLENPARTREYLRHRLGGLPYEAFGLLLLDSRHRLIRALELFHGTIDGASVHPREVVRVVIEAAAAAVVLFHNHPSGVARPSQADELITRRLREALALLDVRVLDHLIVTATEAFSFAEAGRL